MLKFVVVCISCYSLVLCAYCEQLCDVERWLADNEMPMNRLDVSNYAKSRLVKSLKSADKLIQCSSLRAIHREADLDRSFKQSRYKVSNREIRNRREDHAEKVSDRKRGDELKDDSDSPSRASMSDKPLDAVDESGDKSRSPGDWDDGATSQKQVLQTDEGQQKQQQQQQQQQQPQQQPISELQKTQEQRLAQQADQEPNKQSVEMAPAPENATQTSSDQNLTIAANLTNQNSSINSSSAGVSQVTNRTEDSPQQVSTDISANSSLHEAAKNKSASIFLLQQCSTTSSTLKHRSISFWFCHLFKTREPAYSIETKLSALKEPTSTTSDQDIVTHCARCTSTSRQINPNFQHFCDVFFPIRFNKYSTSFLEEVSPVNSTSVENLDSIDHKNSSTAENEINDFISSCLQCTISTGNRTLSMCIFALQAKSPDSDGLVESIARNRMDRQENSMATKLQFIDDKDSAANSIESAAQPMGGELQDTELPTRVRQDAHSKQVQNESNQTAQQPNSEPLGEPGSVQNESSTVVPPVATGPDAQIESLAHSVFMEKLFDSLLGQRAASVESVLNLSRRIDGMKTQLDNMTTTGGKQSDAAESPQLQELDGRLTQIVAQMAQQNRIIIKRMRTLETTLLRRVAAYELRLNRSLAQTESATRRERNQIVRLERRMKKVTDQLQKMRGCRCDQMAAAAAAAHPAMPPIMQESAAGYADSQLQQQRQYFMPNIADAILPNINGKSLIHDCSDIFVQEKTKQLSAPTEISDGVFTANLGLRAPVQVRCDMQNEGWTYVLSRSDGTTDFFRNWTSYRSGFGDPSGEHFLGLDALAEMTSRRQYRLWVVLEDWEGAVKHVNYESFIVLGSQQNYQLRLDHFHGDSGVGDSLSSHSNASFSTFDSDNDLVDKKFGGNCAKRFRGGFWYFSCYRANPTGQYYHGGKIPDKRCDGIVWKTWKGPHYSLKSIQMKIKPL